MKFWRALAFTLVVPTLSAGAAFAQTEPASPSPPSDESSSTERGKFELAPFIGLRTAGSFRGEEQTIVFSVGRSASFGLMFDYFLTDQLALEATWSHQGSDVIRKEAVIGNGTAEDTEEKLFDVGIDYFHGGVRYGGGNDTYEPYVAAGVGIGRLSPDGPEANSTTNFSFSIGTGIIAYIHERVAIRGDVRAFGTRGGDGSTDLSCGVFGCVTFERATTFWQSHFVGAVVIRF